MNWLTFDQWVWMNEWVEKPWNGHELYILMSLYLSTTLHTWHGSSHILVVLVQEPKSWMEAQSSCLLATKEILKSNGLLVNNTDNAIWVNLHGGKWMWSDGTRPSFTHWQSNMPNICRLNELCTISHNGGWETQSCTEKFPSFCHSEFVCWLWSEVRLVRF